MPIGSLIQGYLVDVIGVQWTVTGAGLIFLAVFAVLRFVTDLFPHMDDLSGPGRQPTAADRPAETERDDLEAAAERH
jgi:hypothetical protein